MKLVYFLGEFPLVTENFIIYEIDELIKQGAEIKIFSLSRPSTGRVSEQPEKLGFSDKIYYRPSMDKSAFMRQIETIWFLFKLLCSGNLTALKKVLTDSKTSAEYSRHQLLSTADALRRVEKNPAVIVAHFGPMGRLLAILAEYNLIKTPFTTTFHGYDITSYVKANGNDVYRLLFKKAARLIFVSDFFRQKAIKLGADEQKCVVHHTAINCKEFAFQPRDLPKNAPVRFICVGRMTEKKGHLYLLEAFAKLRQAKPDRAFHLDLVGGGPTEDQVKAKVSELGLEPSVTLHGSVQHNVVRDLLQRAHIFILHSVVASDGDTEGIPGGLMEAMAQGLPVISTYHTGIPELIEHEVSGLLGQERDAEEMLSLMLKLVSAPDIWPALTTAARAKVEAEFERRCETERLYGTLQSLAPCNPSGLHGTCPCNDAKN